MLLLRQSPVFVARLTDSLDSFHWLPAPECIKFKQAVIVDGALHDTALRYLSDTFSHVADILSQSRLRSSTSSQLMIHSSHLVTIGEQSFASGGPRLWNSLPDNITTALSLSDFRRKLETSFSAIISGHCLVVFLAMVDLEVVY